MVRHPEGKNSRLQPGTGWGGEDGRDGGELNYWEEGFNRSHESATARKIYLNSPDFVLCKLLLLQP